MGVKLLGESVSRDGSFISSLAIMSAENTVNLMRILPYLSDPHSKLFLLQSCMGISKLFFGWLRMCQLVHMEEAVIIFENGLRGGD